MESPPDEDQSSTPDKRLKGIDASRYFERYHEKFLVHDGKSVFRFNTEVQNIQRGVNGQGWSVRVRETDPMTKATRDASHSFARIVVCTGGTSAARLPASLTPSDASKVGFAGPALHSSESWAGMNSILASAKASPGKPR